VPTKLRAPTHKPVVLKAVHANVGVQAWFEYQMSEALHLATIDAIRMLTEAWAEAPPTVGIAMDAGVIERWRYDREDRKGQGWDEETGEPCEYTYSVLVGAHYSTLLAADAPSSTRKLDKTLKAWGNKWNKRFDKLSRDVSRSFASKSFRGAETAMKAALKEAGFTVSFKPTRAVLESYKLVVADNVGLIRNLQTNLYNKIQQDTWASVRAGGDMHTLSQKLVSSYGIEAKRAKLIARDQNNKAKAVVETARRKELGLKKAIWQHSSAGKEPRPIHVAWGQEGKVFNLNKGLFDKDEGEYVFPGQLINCRCTSRAIIPGFDDDDN
jgi:hypothetical protein